MSALNYDLKPGQMVLSSAQAPNGKVVRFIYDSISNTFSLLNDEGAVNPGGTSGYSGYSGYSGTVGTSGYSGTLGTSGYSGYSGSTGSSATATPDISYFHKTGYYYSSMRNIVPFGSPMAVGTKTMYAVPVFFGQAAQIKSLMTVCNATGTEKVQIGVYNDGNEGYPYNLQYDTGLLSLSAGVNTVIAGSLAINVNAGLYWLVVSFDSNTVGVFTMPRSASPTILGMDSSGNQYAYITSTHHPVGDGLPDPFTNLGAVTYATGSDVPFVAFAL